MVMKDPNVWVEEDLVTQSLHSPVIVDVFAAEEGFVLRANLLNHPALV
jgi:hypothetical protein